MPLKINSRDQKTGTVQNSNARDSISTGEWHSPSGCREDSFDSIFLQSVVGCEPRQAER